MSPKVESPAAAPPAFVIEAGRSARAYWCDLWHYRDLFFFLAWRDILVRYKQTAFGIAWALLQPLLTMGVFSLVFGRLAQLPTPADTPYPVFVFAAVLPWQFFASALTNAGHSLVGNAHLIAKVYFPRLLVPASAVVPCFVDFALSLGVLGGLLLWLGPAPDWRLLALPPLLLLGAACAFGAGLWVAALTVKYRDFRYVVPFVLQAGLFASPVGFGSQAVPEAWRLAYSLNPLVGIIDGFRWSLLGGRTPLSASALAFAVGVTAVLLVTGLRFFRRTERTFADVI